MKTIFFIINIIITISCIANENHYEFFKENYESSVNLEEFELLSDTLPQKITQETNTSKWVIRDLGTVVQFDGASAIINGASIHHFNEKGQILTECVLKNKNGNKETHIGVSHPVSGFTMISQIPLIMSDTIVAWRTINNDGTVIGIQNIYYWESHTYEPILVTWNISRGVKKYFFGSSFISSKPWFDFMKIAKCGNSSDIILTIDKRIFKLENEKLVELTSKLNDGIKRASCSFYKFNWEAVAVNGMGDICGYVECLDKHPLKDTTTLNCVKLFHWDGDNIKLIDLPQGASLNQYLFRINNDGKILFNWHVGKGMNYCIWDVNYNNVEFKKSRSFSHNSLEYTLEISEILDDGTSVWNSKNMIAFLDSEERLLFIFEEKDNIGISNPNYSNIVLKQPKYFSIDGNQKAVIVSGNFFGEEHPFVLIHQEI